MDVLSFSMVLTIALLCERAIYALSFALLYLMCRVLPEEKAKGAQCLQVASLSANCVVSVFAAIATTLMQFAAMVANWFFTAAFMVLLSVVAFILFQYATDIMFEAVSAYNTSIGPSAQVLLIWPMQFATWWFEMFTPMFNAAMWFWKKLIPQVLVQTVTWNIGLVAEVVKAGGQVLLSLSISLFSWCQSFVCCDSVSVTGCNARCFDTGERIFDLLTPMAHLRVCLVYLVEWLREMCHIVAGPMDLATFPFMDINFAKGVHFVFNSIVYMIFHVPAVTLERCSRFKDDGVIMCVPDFEPVFVMMASGVRYLGLFVDNWLDVLVLVVEATLGRPSPSCTSLVSVLKDVDFRKSAFGSNEFVTVGMTDRLFARTDGMAVQYYSMDRDWHTVVHQEAFPFKVNTAYGVAAVSHLPNVDHDPGGDDTTGLLGCQCAETGMGFTLTCGVAMYADPVHTTDRIVPVQFQLQSTAQLMRCDKVMVKIESIRWPVSRFTATKVQRADGSYAQDVGCATKGTCLQVTTRL